MSIDSRQPVVKMDDDIDFEKQSFDHLDVNPYEIVVAVAKTAREINARAQKFLGPEYELRPSNMALKKLDNDNITFDYDDENDPEVRSPDEK